MAAEKTPSHPSLLLTAQSLRDLKTRIALAPFKDAFAQLKSRVDASLNEKLELPPRGANWFHWYICPTHGNRLKTGRQLSKWTWEHICPVGNHTVASDPSKVETDYDGCCIQGSHNQLSYLVRDAGLLYQVTGDKRYLEKSRSILLAYAEKYLDYPLHTTRGEPKIGGGRTGSQTLDESTWLIPVAQGADLIWNDLPQNDRDLIAEKLLLPAARDVILPHRMGIHNIQCWKNSAVGLVGLLLNDKNLITSAIDDPAAGFRAQIEKGVQDDGLWWENAWGYHFYTLSALWPLTEAARNHGIDLYSPRLKLMFDAPLKFAMPDGALPDFGDSGSVNIRSQGGLYELAYARYKDRAYFSVLREGPRTDNLALYYGLFLIPAAPTTAPKSGNYPTSGYAILTQHPFQQQSWLCLKYGLHGGGHGHPDKLSFIYYTDGRILAPDAGITSYGSPLHSSWFRTTLAHNTLTVDEQNQKATTGKCIAFGTQKGIDYVVADAGSIYDGVTFIRTAAMFNNSVLFIDHVHVDKPRQLDLAYHQRGAWTALPQGQPWQPPNKPGYQRLADCTIRPITDTLKLSLSSQDRIPRELLVAGSTPTQVITATGPGASTADRVPALILRRTTADTAFICCIAPASATAKVQILPVKDAAGAEPPASQAAAVEITVGAKTLRILSNPGRRPVTVTLPGNSTWSSQAAFDVR